jgi:hypothetical protein
MPKLSSAPANSSDASDRQLEALKAQRDLSAYNCVNAIQFCLLFFEAQDFEGSRKHLQDAFDKHREADDAITEFHRTHALNLKKENSHVPSTAPSSESVA